MSTSHIAVVGAGIGGLACARGLQLHGHTVTVFEREDSRDSRGQGGMLDLHADTGQAAMRALGLYDRFRALARPDAQELRGLDPVTAELVLFEQPADGERAAPEIDRGQLRGLILDSLAPGTIRWGSPARSVTPLPDGTARLKVGDAVEDFDLVIGADGARSRIRPAVSAATPAYGGRTIVETHLDDVDTRHPALAALVGPGTLMAKGGGKMLSAQRNSGGHVRVYVMLDAPADWHVATGIDLADAEAVREHLLGRLAGWDEGLLDLVRRGEGEFYNRPLYVLPVEHTWEHVPGVTLLGDAAHLMPPYGIGANLALLDGAELAGADRRARRARRGRAGLRGRAVPALDRGGAVVRGDGRGDGSGRDHQCGCRAAAVRGGSHPLSSFSSTGRAAATASSPARSGSAPLIHRAAKPCAMDQAASRMSPEARSAGTAWRRPSSRAFEARFSAVVSSGSSACSSAGWNMTSKCAGCVVANRTYDTPASRKSSPAAARASASRPKPSAATAVSRPALSPKWWAGAAWETPARRASSRRLQPAGPDSLMASTAAARIVRRRSPWWYPRGALMVITPRLLNLTLTRYRATVTV